MFVSLYLQAAVSLSASVGEFKAPSFAAPQRLFAGESPLNLVEEMPYPSPVMFDIDGDGNRELVCGDLWGYLRVYEDEGRTEELHWGTAQMLQSNGEVLRVPNW